MTAERGGAGERVAVPVHAPGGSHRHLFLLTQGYGVLDGPTMPIIADGGGEPNDRYVPQLVASAQAAVDEIVRLGVADRERIGVGGHSYGAFMTANLLSHSNIFKRRHRAQRRLQPDADAVRVPGGAAQLLGGAGDLHRDVAVHARAQGDGADAAHPRGRRRQPGHLPRAERALLRGAQGERQTARLVMLPAEPHGYRARESNGHVLQETVSGSTAT